MLFIKIEMFGTQKSAMPLLFSNFDILPIYKADLAGSRTYPFDLCLKISFLAKKNKNSKFLKTALSGKAKF